VTDSGFLNRNSRLIVLLLCFLPAGVIAGSYTLFESAPVRTVALSADGQRLFVANTPDNHLEIYTFGSNGMQHTASVPVGMEPVAVATRGNNEVWVVNHLSDSVSIVDVAVTPPRTVATLQVGDEPRDIVFAGPGRNRAFITTAHRGQHSPYTDPANPGELTTPGIGRADVWVFEADDAGQDAGGVPLTIVTLFGDTPRALATSPNGNIVYAAVFQSGKQSTVIHGRAVCVGGESAAPCAPTPGELLAPGGLPSPNTNVEGVEQPRVGIIVQQRDGEWRDELGRDWSSMVRFNLPDQDVFAIDAMADPPRELASVGQVGTALFNMAVNPASGKLYVSNTEAGNAVRFEGERPAGDSTSSVRGHLHEARITVIDQVGGVFPRNLNKHIDYSQVPSPPGTWENSLATPMGMAVTSDGKTLYLAAFGSGKLGVFDTAQLENDSFQPDSGTHIPLSGGGPGAMVLDEQRRRIYVTTRFDNGLSVIDMDSRVEVAHLLMPNPEPPSVTQGRRFLYDATLTSSNGEASCAACHLFGDTDGLSWDLGDPLGLVRPNPNPGIGPELPNTFHPMKETVAPRTPVVIPWMKWARSRSSMLRSAACWAARPRWRMLICRPSRNSPCRLAIRQIQSGHWTIA
jgi:DNA-binding beta-propeller fold protein YncE